MTAETDIAAIDDGGQNTAAEVRTALTSVLTEIPTWVREVANPSTGTVIDNFDDASFTGWTTVTVTGAQTITEGNDLLSINPTSTIDAGDANCILQSNSLAVGDAIEICISNMVTDDAERMVAGPIITDGTTSTSNCVYGHLQLFTTDQRNWVYPSGSSATLTALGTGIGKGLDMSQISRIFLRLEHDATNSFKYWFSVDQVTWHLAFTISRTLTPSHIGVGWNTSGDAATYTSFSVEYVKTVTV